MADPKKPSDNMAIAEAQIQAMLEMANKKVEDMLVAAEKRAAEIVSGAQAARPVRVVKTEPMVQVKLKKDKEKNNADLPVTVNGKTHLLQRGVWVNIPLSYSEVLDNSESQEEYAIRYSEGLSEAFAEKLKQL